MLVTDKVDTAGGGSVVQKGTSRGRRGGSMLACALQQGLGLQMPWHAASPAAALRAPELLAAGRCSMMLCRPTPMDHAAAQSFATVTVVTWCSSRSST